MPGTVKIIFMKFNKIFLKKVFFKNEYPSAQTLRHGITDFESTFPAHTYTLGNLYWVIYSHLILSHILVSLHKSFHSHVVCWSRLYMHILPGHKLRISFWRNISPSFSAEGLDKCDSVSFLSAVYTMGTMKHFSQRCGLAT